MYIEVVENAIISTTKSSPQVCSTAALSSHSKVPTTMVVLKRLSKLTNNAVECELTMLLSVSPIFNSVQ